MECLPVDHSSPFSISDRCFTRKESTSLGSSLHRAIPSSSSSQQRSKTVMSPFHPRFALYTPSWSATCDIGSLSKSSNRAYGQMKSKRHSFERRRLLTSLNSFSTTVHYLPKSHPTPSALLWPRISLMDAKRFGLECNGNWKTTEARPISEVEDGMRVLVCSWILSPCYCCND